MRLIVTRGGRRVWREEPIPAEFPDGMRVLPVPHRVTPLLIGAKTLSYAANMQAARRARAAGCHDALLVNADDDLVLEGPTWSLGWLDGDVLVFPPLELGVLDSLTRRLAYEALPVREHRAELGELADADGALTLSTAWRPGRWPRSGAWRATTRRPSRCSRRRPRSARSSPPPSPDAQRASRPRRAQVVEDRRG